MDGQEERKGRTPDVQEDKPPVDPLTKAREKSVFFFNKTDEAKRVIEEDRQRQNYQGYSIIGGQFSITNVSVFRNYARNFIRQQFENFKRLFEYMSDKC